MAIVFIVIYAVCSLFRAAVQIISEKKNISKAILTSATIVHLSLAGLLSLIAVMNSDPSTGDTRYYVNFIEVTALVDNPVTNFLVLFCILGGLGFLVPWVIIELILMQKRIVSKMSGEERLATASLFAGIIAFPISIIFAINLQEKAWPFVLAFCVIIIICGLVSCMKRKKKKEKIYKRAVAGLVFATYYLVVAINMIRMLIM